MKTITLFFTSFLINNAWSFFGLLYYNLSFDLYNLFLIMLLNLIGTLLIFKLLFLIKELCLIYFF
jgi:hypothetical protein